MLIKIINLLHLLLILTIICSVIIPCRKLKELIFTLLIFIFIQYITNYGKCGLTELEYLLKGEQYQEGFIYRLVKPIITISEKYIDMYLYIVHIIWIVILGYQLNYFSYI
jgi:hypothetical protein